MAKKTYLVITPVTHDQKDYVPGKPITLDEDIAAPLLAVKAIAENPEKDKS